MINVNQERSPIEKRKKWEESQGTAQKAGKMKQPGRQDRAQGWSEGQRGQEPAAEGRGCRGRVGRRLTAEVRVLLAVQGAGGMLGLRESWTLLAPVSEPAEPSLKTSPRAEQE